MKVRFLLTSSLLSVIAMGSSNAWAQDSSDVTINAAQKFSISGSLLDETESPVIFQQVLLLDSAKTKTIGNVVTDSAGNYSFSDVRPGSYVVSVDMDGYKPFVQLINVLNGNLTLSAINMQLAANSTDVKTVTVTANIPVKQMGDTTQYNANSYKVNPDATSEDLLRKMPGVDMSSGTPKVQGESVQRVYVDGKAFFGDDATSTLRNLPAEVVDQVQIYDEKSEQSKMTGFDDGNTTKAINIVTKPDKRGGYFGKFIAGGGTDDRYNLSGNVNYFNGNRRLTVIGQSNNINAQNFSAQNLIGTSSGGGGRGAGGGISGNGGSGGTFGGGSSSSSGGTGGASFMNGGQSGIVKTNTIGLNYSDKLFNKIDIAASYFFNNNNSNVQQQTYRDVFAGANIGQVYNEGDTTHAKNYNHRFYMRATYQIDSSNTVLWIPTFSYQKNNSIENVLGNTVDSSSNLLNNTLNTTNAHLQGYSFSNTAIYAHKFKKANRSFSLMMTNGLNKNYGNSSLLADLEYYGDVDSTSYLNQYSNPNTNSWNVGGSATYSEPVGKYGALQVQYDVNYTKSKSDKETFDYNEVTNAYSDLNSELSNKYQSYYLTNAAGLKYRFNSSKVRFLLGVSGQRASLNSDRVLPEISTITRSYNNVLPNAMFRYSFSKSKNLMMFYRTSTASPSVTQLQDVINNSNPLQLSSGNPDLNQSYSHNLFMRYSTADMGTGSMFFAMLRGSLTQHYVGNSTITATEDMVVNNVTLAKGSQYSRPVNLNGYYTLNGFAVWGKPIKSLSSNFNANLSAGVTRTPGIVNEVMNYSNNRNVGLGLMLSSNISENVDFTISSNTNMNFVHNSINTSGSNNNYLNQISRASFNYIFYKGFVFNTEVNHYLYRGMSSSTYNQNFVLWNMYVAKKFLKNNSGEIKISVYDLLKQNRSITPTFTESYNQYVLSNALQRYFMLTFTYTLRKFKGQSSEKDMQSDDRRGFRGRPDGPGGPGGPPGGGMMPPPGN